MAVAEPMSGQYNNTYLSFGDFVIDYSLAERSKNLAVVSASFDWMDIGNLKDLHEANQPGRNGNCLKGDNIYDIELENAYVQNDEAKPVTVIGLDNVLVVNTPNGILVARKDLSQKVREAVTKINEKNAQ